ncbi:MAG TPA: ATP-binding protein [Myxococcales bacterium]|nr:ATP-binding protein [Myxococcales bacterium]
MQAELAATQPRREGIGRRYQVLGFRGSGAAASVHLAVDLFTGEHVALKQGRADLLAAEYQRSAALTHPHLARALSLWRDAKGTSLALEYGAEDLTALRGAAEATVVEHVAGVARALGHLHRRGIVHSDVKPQNVVLTGPEGARRPLLVDLGLAGDERLARGTLEYAAPEVLEGGAPDVAADLYSLGVTLHELLSGKNPFAAASPAEVVRAHFETVPVPRASSGVQAVVAKLLAREPRSRYSHADEVIEALAAATGLPLESEGEGLAFDQLGMGQLYGRDAELARIETASRRAAEGQGAQFVIVGPARSGRSRLLRAAAVSAELAGLRVLHLQTNQGLPTLCLWLGLLLGGRVRLEPTVGAAKKELATACAQHPLALLVDGVDRADGTLRSLLVALAADPAWKRRPLLVVAAASDKVEHSLERIELRPLPPAVRKSKLLEALGSRRPWAEGVADLLARETSGHPGDLEEAVRDLVVRGLLERRAGRWELDAARAGVDFAGCVPHPSLRAARTAIRALPEEVQIALGFAAVLWPEIGARALAGDEETLVADGLVAAETLGLPLSQMAVSRAAETALPAVVRRRAHLRAAALAREQARRARHLFRAGMSGHVRAALGAARERLRAGAPVEAARLYQIARAGLRHPFASARAAALCERAGDCLALAGFPQFARREYAQALARGGHAGRILQKIAKTHWQDGRFDRVLEVLGRARGAGADQLAVATVEARAQAMLGAYVRAEELATAALSLARARQDAGAASRLHHLLGTCAWHRGDGRRALVEERAAVLTARRSSDRRAEADARAGLGTAYRYLMKYDRSAREALRAVELYRAVGDERQEAIAWNNLGAARYLAGNWDGALDAWERLRERSQTVEERLLLLNNLGSLYRERGDLPRAKDLLNRALAEIAESRGHARLEAMVRGNLGEIAAREGDVREAEALYRQTQEIAHRLGARDELVETERRLAELDLLLGDPAAAETRASAALSLAIESKNLVEEGNLRRVCAVAGRARGDAPAAAEAIAASRHLLERSGATLELARTDCVVCALALDRSEPIAAADALKRARTVFENLGAAPDLREVERLQKDLEALQGRSLSQVDALTQAAQRLAVCNGSAALLEEVLREALFLTGAERGCILLTEESGVPRVAAVRGVEAGATLRISRTVADRVLRSGEMLAVADIVGSEELSTRRSILDLRLRSVLCAPIRFAGRQLGILYVDSRRVGSLLSERDLGLLNAFAALAGSALENARLIDDLRRKSELLAHMAHEFRTPLQSIQAYGQRVGSGPDLGNHGRQGIEVISSEAARLSKLVDRTLELAQMEAGAVKLAREKVDLLQVARAAIGALIPLAAVKSIELALSVDDEVPPVLGDFDRLVQVLTNLIGNAIHYSGNDTVVSVRLTRGDPLVTPTPGPRIEVEGSPLSDDAGGESQSRSSAQIAVVDQGRGIAPEDLPDLYTPFFAARKGNGAGLGLVITREIVRQHGGELRVESKPGQGTTFTVLLPGVP